ncbi:MAG TPA: NHL repeat-containing protein [Candidatus Binataceae bacterium]|nr:NHL repeat-containing protein [Candidatus Binataceae bacterium]
MSQPIAADAALQRAMKATPQAAERQLRRLDGGALMLVAYMRCSLSTMLLLMFAVSAGGCSRGGDNGGAADQRLFVTAPADHTIAVYANGASGSAAPLQLIKEAATDRPVAAAVDLVGGLFVANANGNVRVFMPKPTGEYDFLKSFEGPNTRIAHPVAIAVSPAGSFYVADAGDGHGRVEWFSGGASGDIYVDRVIEGPRSGITTPSGLAVDGSQRAFVADRSSHRVLVFAADANGDAAPVGVIDGLQAPSQVAVDDALNVYVADDADSSVVVFSNNGPASWSRTATITSDALKRPAGVAVDQDGRIAVAAADGILFFPGNANGRVAPALSLAAPAPTQPAGICFSSTANP